MLFFAYIISYIEVYYIKLYECIAERSNESDSVTNEDSSDNQLGSNVNVSYTTAGNSSTSTIGNSMNVMQAIKNSGQKERSDHAETSSHHHGQSGIGQDVVKDFKSKITSNMGSSYISAKKSGQMNKKTRYR